MEEAKSDESKEGVTEENKNEKDACHHQTFQYLLSSSEVKMGHSAPFH